MNRRHFKQNFTRSCGHALCLTLISAIAWSCSSGTSDDTGKTTLDAPRTQASDAVGWSTIKMNGYNYADTEIDDSAHFKTVPNACHQDAAGAITISLWNPLTQVMNRALSKPLREDATDHCFARPDDSKLFGTVDVVLQVQVPNSHPNVIAESPTPAPTTPSPSSTSDPFPWPWASSSPTSSPTATPTPSHTVSPSPTPSASPSPSPSPSPSGVTKTILENRGDVICTTIQDLQAAKDLVNYLDQVAAIAYKEDCERTIY